MKDRIAIQLAGQIRDWFLAFPHWQSLASEFKEAGIEVDFFLSTWDRYGIKTDNKGAVSGADLDIDLSFLKGYNIFNHETFEKDFANKPTTWHMAHHWSSSSLLRLNYENKHRLEYKAILLSRPDLIFTEHIKYFINFIKQIGPSTNLDPRGVYTNQGTIALYAPNRIDRADLYSDDMWVFGHRVAMNHLILMFDYIREGLICGINHIFIADFLKKMGLYNWRLLSSEVLKNTLTRYVIENERKSKEKKIKEKKGSVKSKLH